MNRDFILIGGLTLIALGLLGAWYISVKEPRLSQKSAGSPVEAVDHRHPLVKEQGVGIIYKLDQQTQDTLIAAVEQFCVKNYQRESCIHHFATCGHPCLVVIPFEKRKAIVEDYKILRRASGLPELMALPKED